MLSLMLKSNVDKKKKELLKIDRVFGCGHTTKDTANGQKNGIFRGRFLIDFLREFLEHFSQLVSVHMRERSCMKVCASL